MQVSDPYQVEKVIEKVTTDFGKLSCFIANAGMTIPKPLLETSLDEYRAQVAVNRKLKSEFTRDVSLAWSANTMTQWMGSFTVPSMLD